MYNFISYFTFMLNCVVRDWMCLYLNCIVLTWNMREIVHLLRVATFQSASNSLQTCESLRYRNVTRLEAKTTSSRPLSTWSHSTWLHLTAACPGFPGWWPPCLLPTIDIVYQQTLFMTFCLLRVNTLMYLSPLPPMWILLLTQCACLRYVCVLTCVFLTFQLLLCVYICRIFIKNK